MAPTPPELPLRHAPNRWRLVRLVLMGVAQAGTLLLLAWLFDSVKIADFGSAIVVVVVLALIGVVVWPLVVRITLPLVMATAGLFALVLNGVSVLVTAALVDGFSVGSWWMGLFVAFVLTTVNVLVGGLLSIDDDHAWSQIITRRIAKRHGDIERTDVPGILFIQIDGLGHDVLEGAMASGHAPTLAAFVEQGTHDLLGWECDLSSQTGAMQAGILLGDNSEMPAFRWYEKDSGRILVSNRPKDAAEIERRQSTGNGLLSGGGASRSNVFSGDADDSMFTFSTVLDRPLKRRGLEYVVKTPSAMLRIFVLLIADITRELRAARRARRDGVEPRMHRGGVYPLLRAATTVVLPEITYAVLIADISRGVSVAYADLVGYDEVAHHSGIAAPDALAALGRTDDQLRRLFSTIERAPRPYYVVVLSDHGQTQGWSFEQRNGRSLEAVVADLASGAAVAAPELAAEGWTNVNGLLSDAAADESRVGRTVARATRKRTDEDGEVALGPAPVAKIEPDDGEIVVLASGNLALLSFAKIEGRATREQIEAGYPGLIDGLRCQDGIGLILVRGDDGRDIVLGPAGSYCLDDGTVDGVDPLGPFGPNVADHLRRTSGFSNCPDLLVNSFFDPDTVEGAAFEEQVGFHGGLGGPQCHPFVLAPAQLSRTDGPLVGARSIHDLFMGWRREVQGEI